MRCGDSIWDQYMPSEAMCGAINHNLKRISQVRPIQEPRSVPWKTYLVPSRRTHLTPLQCPKVVNSQAKVFDKQPQVTLLLFPNENAGSLFDLVKQTQSEQSDQKDK